MEWGGYCGMRVLCIGFGMIVILCDFFVYDCCIVYGVYSGQVGIVLYVGVLLGW